jgi:tellurite resistance protein
MHREEASILDALVLAFELDEHDAERLRAFAKEPRTLDDLPKAQLSDVDRRALLRHALLITHADGHQSLAEQNTVRELARRLEVPDHDVESLLAEAQRRASRLSGLR